MVKKLVDVKSKPKKTKKSIWNLKKSPKTNAFERALPLLVIGFALFLISNSVHVYFQGKQVASNIIDLSKSGYFQLEQAKESIQNSDWITASQSFEAAEQSFADLAKNARLVEYSVGAPKHLADAGEKLSQTGKSLSALAPDLANLPNEIIQANKSLQAEPNYDIYENSLTEKIASTIPQAELAHENLTSAINSLNQIQTRLLPKNLRQDFQSGLLELEQMNQKLDSAKQNLPTLLNLLGHDIPHRYLILVQNNHELRGTGGFMGGLIFAEVSQGYLTSFEYHDVYQYDGQLTDTLDVPPEFSGFFDQVYLRDSNFNPDFAISANRADKLLQRSGGPSFDTIISIDNSVIEDALKITGPIYLDNFPSSSITSDTYDVVLTYLEEINPTNTALTSDFVSKFKDQLFAQANFENLSSTILQNIKLKHIQFYSKHPDIQNLLVDLEFDNQIPKELSPKEDYLLVTSTSIGGNKTDKYMHQRIIHETKLSKDYKLENKVTVRKFHSFNDLEEVYWLNMLKPFGVQSLKDEVRYILGRGDNHSQIKVYVPQGSKLTATSGIEFTRVKTVNDTENQKTYFLFPMKLSPGQTQEVTISYELPFELKLKPVETYKLFVQKQSGKDDIIFEKRFELPKRFQINRFYPSDYRLEAGGKYVYQKILDQDLKVSTILSK